MERILQIEFLANQISDYAIAVAIVIVGFVAIQIFKVILTKSLKRWATQRSTPVDNTLIRLVEKAIVPLLQIGVVYVAIANLTLHPILAQTVRVVAVFAATFIAIQLLSHIAEYLLRLYLLRQDNPNLEQSLDAFGPAIRVILWAIGIIFLLDNLGFNISAIVASLGIGGVAIALASQGLLQDLFSYFSILFDRPFEIGDFIIVGDFAGTVKDIGIKTTRLESLSGEEVVFPNTDLTGSRLQNFKKMQQRRIAFKIGVVYETPLEQVEAIPDIIKEIVSNIEGTSFDRAHFSEYGDFSLNFEIVYFVVNSDFALYMDIQQKINLALFKEFADRRIEFAYPTNVTYLHTLAGDRAVR